MRYVKYGLYVLAALVIVTGLVFAYIAATFDPNAYKGDITRLVNEKTGRNLSIDGDIGLAFFPKIAISLGTTRLSERGSDVEFAGVDDFRLALALFPLLAGQVVVDEVVLDGLRARLIKYADGTTNIDDLVSPDRAAQSQDAEDGGQTEDADGSAVKLDIDGVRIVNAAFTWKDEQAGATYEISDLSLKTGRVAPGVPAAFQYQAVVRADEPRLDLRTRASGTLDADIDKQIFKVTALKAGVDGNAATLTDLSVTVSANLEARTGQQWVGLTALVLDASGAMGKDTFKTRLEVPDLVLDKSAIAVKQLVATLTGEFAGTKVSEARLDAPKLDIDLDSQRIVIEALALRAAGQRGADSFSIKLDAPQLTITPDEAGGAAIVAALQARGPDLRADANIRLSAVSGSARALRIGELAIELDAKQAENAIKGRLTTPLTADLEKQVFELSRIVGNYELRSPALPTKTAALSLKSTIGADVKREAVNVDLKAKFDESNITGAIGIKKFSDPFFKFDVAIDQLNIDKYKPPKEKSSDGGATDGKKKKEAPFDLSPLKTLNLDGTLRIGSLIASNVKMTELRADIKAAGGKVVIDPFLAKLYGGAIRGIVTADANTNQFTVKQTLSNVTVGPLLHDSLDQDLLDGRGNLALDLTAQGDTLGALTKSLTGAASVALKDGSVKGINLAKSMRSAGDMLSLKKNTETAASATEKTDFSDLVASFVIDNGKARNDDLSLKSPFLRLTGKGDLDIAAGGLDYLANVALVASSTGQEGKDIGNLAGVTIPVQISGPLTALKYRLKFSDATVADQAKQRVKAEQEKLEIKLKTRLTDKLLGGDDAAAPASDANAAPAAPTETPKEELKSRLKKLLR